MLDNNAINKMIDENSERKNDTMIRRKLAYQYGKDLYEQTLALFVQAINEFVSLAPKYGLGATTNTADASHPNPLVIPCSEEEYKEIRRRMGLFTTRSQKAWFWFAELHEKNRVQETALENGLALLPPVFEGTSLDRHLKKKQRENREILKSFGSAFYPLLSASGLYGNALQVSERGVLRRISPSSAKMWSDPEEYFRDNFHTYLDIKLFPDAPIGMLLEHSDTKKRYGGDLHAPLTPKEYERDLTEQSQKLLADSKNAIKQICEAALAGTPSSSLQGFGERIVIYSSHVVG